MSEPEASGSVSLWISAMKRGDKPPVVALCDRYLARLTRVAERRLTRSSCGVCDGEDVAIEAFENMYFAAISGRLKKVTNRGELWRLLAISASRRAAETCRSELQLKRRGKFRDRRPLAGIRSSAPPVDFGMIMADQQEYLLGMLRDDTLREIALWRLDGQTVEQIARHLKILPRSVRRKLALIREKWSRALERERSQVEP